MRAVCCALSVSRSHVLTMRDRSSEWTDLRKSPPRHDDATVKQAIANVVKDRATYGYRRVWARLRLEGCDRANHKRVYRVMRDEGWLLYRHGAKPIDNRKHEGKVAVKESDVRWCSDGLELSCDNGSCYTAPETRSFAKQLGLKPVTTAVTSPQSKGMAESFV